MGAILEFTRQGCIKSSNQKWLLMVDGCPDWCSPRTNKGHRPDLYVWGAKSKGTIVKEVKTESDLITSRSKNQIDGFIDYLTKRERKNTLTQQILQPNIEEALRLLPSTSMVGFLPNISGYTYLLTN